MHFDVSPVLPRTKICKKKSVIKCEKKIKNSNKTSKSCKQTTGCVEIWRGWVWEGCPLPQRGVWRASPHPQQNFKGAKLQLHFGTIIMLLEIWSAKHHYKKDLALKIKGIFLYIRYKEPIRCLEESNFKVFDASKNPFWCAMGSFGTQTPHLHGPLIGRLAV